LSGDEMIYSCVTATMRHLENGFKCLRNATFSKHGTHCGHRWQPEHSPIPSDPIYIILQKTDA